VITTRGGGCVGGRLRENNNRNAHNNRGHNNDNNYNNDDDKNALASITRKKAK